MADSFCPEKMDGVPDALRSAGFACVIGPCPDYKICTAFKHCLPRETGTCFAWVHCRIGSIA